ncbi:MAG: lipB [Solirubrobacterales bacterium]|nr:lipB [Solirubrobacterales bacterium]
MSFPDRSAHDLWVCHLGVVAYREALEIQEQVRAQRLSDELPDTLLLLEHPPVYTRGRRSGAEDLPLSEDFYRAKGIDVFATDRGGRLTYHGPGQLVGYPIMRIDDVHRYLRTMEDAIVAALGDAGVHARSRHDEGIDYTGVWVQERKIASIGVHVSRGVTTHGFAVNVANDLDPFSWVLACGLPDVVMTSIAQETSGAGEGVPCFRRRVAHAFAQAHGRRQRLVSPARLGLDTTNAARRATERAPIEGVPSPAAEPVPA